MSARSLSATVITLLAACLLGVSLGGCQGCSTGLVPQPDAEDADVDGVEAADAIDTPSDIDDTQEAGDTVEEDATGDGIEDAVDVVEEETVDPFFTDDDGDGFSEYEGDCDDTDGGIFPGATIHVEGIDYDCDTRREFLARMYVAVDDAFDLCVNGLAVGSCLPPTGDTCFRESTYYEVIMESGLNSVGVKGWDVVGVTAAFGMWIEVAGTEYSTRGTRPGEPDSTPWRYFPTSGEEPQITWCDQAFDDSTWGPAVFADEVGDGAWLYQPEELVRLGATWLWDGNPPGLADSWFRTKIMLPDTDPVWAPSGTPTCALGTPEVVSDATRRLYNGVDVAWTGSGWMIVFDQWIRSWSAGVDDDFTRLLNPDGTPAAAAVTINDTAATWWNTWPAAAWTGSRLGVFFEDGRANRNVDALYGRLADATGGPVGTADTDLETVSSRQKYPCAAWSGSEFGVVWQDDRDGGNEIYFRRVSSAMAPVGAATRVTSAAGASRMPSIAWSGSEWGIVWEDDRDAGDLEIYLARVSSTGTKVGSDVRLTAAPGQSRAPSIAWSGSAYGVTWQDDGWVNSEIGFVAVDPTGTVTAGPVRVTEDSSVSATPDIVWAGSGFGIAWRDGRSGHADIWLAVLAPDGTKLAGDDAVTDTDGRSMHPAIAWSGSAFGVTWMEEEDPSDPASLPWYMDAWFVTVTCP